MGLKVREGTTQRAMSVEILLTAAQLFEKSHLKRLYTVSQKKRPTFKLSLTTWNLNRFSNFSSLGCLAATCRVKWAMASPAAVAEQCRERGELGRYPAGTRTCHQRYGAWLAASAVSVARPGNNDHRPLRLAERKRVENSRALTRPLRPSDLLNVGRQCSKRSAAMLRFLVSRGA